MNLFGRVRENGAAAPLGARAQAPALVRHSNGLREFAATLRGAEGLSVLDLGHTSNANLSFLSDLGHRSRHEDLLLACAEAKYKVKTESDGLQFDVERFLAANLTYGTGTLDGVLLWDLPDYLEEPLVRPLVHRLAEALRPGGTVLAYFHTRDAGPGAPFYRYNIKDGENLELRPGESRQLLRIFNNRNIENLFGGFRSLKFFLARDNLREVLVVK
ncbi:MAG: SAM-dependent methyltransferase [Terriglobales bacterium]